MWTAAITSPDTRRLFVNGLAYWLNYTSTNRAFTDLYETIGSGSYPVSPSPVYFIARPVVGGHFSLLALLRAGENGQTGTSTSDCVVAVNDTSAMDENTAGCLTVSTIGATASGNLSTVVRRIRA